MNFLRSIFLLLSLTHCVSLRTVSLTAIPKDRSKPVSASVEKYMPLFLNFSNDYVYALSSRLRTECEGGVVSGILTKNETICYLPLCLFLKNKITATGYCKV